MPLHDAVGINCKWGATTENQGSGVYLDECVCVCVCVCVCYLTSHAYSSFVEGESHGILLLLVFDLVLTRSAPISSQDFYCSLPWDQLRDVTPRLGVFVILQCTSFRGCIFIPAAIYTTM